MTPSPLGIAAASDRGRKRAGNEDAWYADADEGILVISDGMGGEPAGSIASSVVVEILPLMLRQQFSGAADLRAGEAAEALGQAVAQLSDQLRCRTESLPAMRGMGATVVAAVIRGRQLILTHLGDSRAYHLRGTTLQRLTRDDTLAQALVDSGAIAESEASSHPSRYRLIQHIGMAGHPTPQTQAQDLQPDDLLLLCTDGLTASVPESKILDLMVAPGSLDQRAEELIRAANAAGGCDNVTVILAQIPR